jgi:hypothetical protein
MLDRLSAGLVDLPASTYDLVLILSDASAGFGESLSLLSRSVLGPVAESLKPLGKLQAQNGSALGDNTALAKEAVLAGLVVASGGFDKPDYGSGEGTVSLKLGGKKNKKSDAGPAVGSATVKVNGSATKVDMKPPAPAGVGFIDFSDDLDGGYEDDELIDEDTLMTEEDLKRPINIRKFVLLFAAHRLYVVGYPANMPSLT